MTSDVSETSGVNKIFANLLSIGEKSSSFRLYILFIVVSVFFQGDKRNREELERRIQKRRSGSNLPMSGAASVSVIDSEK